MKNNLTTLVATIIGLALPLAQGQEMRPGKWQITNQTEMIGSPVKMPAQSHTSTVCIDNKNKDKPPIPTGNNSCKPATVKTSGNTTSWRVDCPGSMTGEGTTTVNGDSYMGSSVMTIKDTGSSPMKMKSTFNGKRVGDC